MTVGQRIKQRRLELDMSVDELACKLGKNKATVYRYESDDIAKLPITLLEPLAKALDTKPQYLMGWYDETESADKKTQLDRLIEYYNMLTDTGKKKLLERAIELTYIPQYITEINIAAHEKSDSTEREKQADIQMITSDDF